MCCTGMLLLFGVSCSPGGGCGTADAMASWCPWRVLRLRLLPVKEKMIKVTVRPIKLGLIFFLLFTADARNVCVNRVISQNEAVRWKQIKTHINEWSKPRSRIVTFGLTRFFKVDGGAFFFRGDADPRAREMEVVWSRRKRWENWMMKKRRERFKPRERKYGEMK